MTWYEIIFAISGILFLLQFVASFFFGDIDLDGDLDAGDILSFKGIIHFLLGSSAVMSLYQSTSIAVCIGAICSGLICTFLLGWVYKILYKTLPSEIPYTENIEHQQAIVYYFNKETHNGICSIVLPEGVTHIPFKSDSAYNTGDIITVSGNRTEVHIINNKN